MKTLHSRIAFLVVMVLSVFSLLSPAAIAGPPKSKMDAPTVSCGTSTRVSINLVVCAGASGAPGGFSVQWMTKADYAANGNTWFLSDDPRLCKASFSGNANATRYNLLPGECATVTIGDILMDNGASTNCPSNLVCGTDYVFRVFAHASSTLQRSDFTGTLTCTTSPCPPEGTSCFLSQGYFKTHTDVTATLVGGGLTIGGITYSATEITTILNTIPAQGNSVLILGHQVIAAQLSLLSSGGTADPDLAAMLAAAEAYLTGKNLLTDYNKDAAASALGNQISVYIGEHHCL